MTKKLKKRLYRIIAGAVCYAACMALEKLVPVSNNVLLIAFLVTYFIIGGDVLKGAAQNIIKGQIFDEKFLMVIATIGAFLSSQYPEAVAVMLFYQIGELFQSYAVGKSRRNISELMDIRPDYANIETDGQIEKVDPDEVEIGTVIIVQPGEKVPIDGVVVEGHSSLNTSALTGESVPREVAVGEEIISGCINISGLLKIRTTKEFGESTVSKILDLVENASSKKSRSENFISKICQILYTGSLLRRAGTGNTATACPHAVYGASGRLGHLDFPCTDISGYQLSVCAGYQYSAGLFQRYRRCFEGRRAL